MHRLPAHATASGTGWVVGGGITLTRLREVTGIDLRNGAPAGGPETLTDWVSRQLGREVRGGDVIDRDAVRVVVRKLRRHQVMEAQGSRGGGS